MLWNLRGSQSVSGETVTEETALTYSAVFNAVALYSGTISTLPLHLFRKDGKNKILADDMPLFWVLYLKANPYMTALALRETMMAHVLLWGNAYAEIVRDRMGQIVELWPIAPNRVKPEMENSKLVYRIRVDSEEITLPREKILHIPGLGFDGFVGYSVVAMARKSLGLGMALETFGSKYFGTGMHPSAILTHPGQLKDPKSFREAVSTVYGGLGNAQQLMVLEDGMKFEQISIPVEDSQFLESRQFQIPEIARWFNLPPHKLKDLTKSSFNNIESEQISFVTDSVLPWLVRFEQNYNIQLLYTNQRKAENLYFKHNVEGLLRGNAESRGNFYKALFNVGAISINEIRSKEDMDPIDGGDEYFVPLNMVPLSKLDDYMALQEQKGTKTTEGK